MPKYKFAIKYCCATHNNVVLLTVTCTLTVNAEIIAFELKEWFRENPVMSCYKHIASLFVVKFLSNKHSCSLDKTHISWNIPAAGVFEVLSSKVSAFFHKLRYCHSSCKIRFMLLEFLTDISIKI
jgi:hypothetical protein